MENCHVTFTLSPLETLMFLRRFYKALLRIKCCSPTIYSIVRPFVKRFTKSISFELKTVSSHKEIAVPWSIWVMVAPHSGAGITQCSWKETLGADAIEKVRLEMKRELTTIAPIPAQKRSLVRVQSTTEQTASLRVPAFALT